MPVDYTQMELKIQKEKKSTMKKTSRWLHKHQTSVTKNPGLFSSKGWLFTFKAPLVEQMQ